MDFRGQPETNREYGLSGTKPVINKGCMLVHERGQETVEVEWYRVSRDY